MIEWGRYLMVPPETMDLYGHVTEDTLVREMQKMESKRIV